MRGVLIIITAMMLGWAAVLGVGFLVWYLL